MRASWAVGSLPARSAENGPSLTASATSIMRPPSWAETEMPLPRCATIRRNCVYARPVSLAYRLATALVLRACEREMRSIDASPETRAISGHSSTLTGSTMKASTPARAATARARTAPRFEACSPRRASRKSSSIAWFTRYVPLRTGPSSPPRPATAWKPDRSSPAAASSRSTASRRNSSWSSTGLPRNGAISASECRRFRTSTAWEPAKTPNLVEVDPGLIASIRYSTGGKDHPQGDGVHLVFGAFHARRNENRRLRPHHDVRAGRASQVLRRLAEHVGGLDARRHQTVRVARHRAVDSLRRRRQFQQRVVHGQRTVNLRVPEYSLRTHRGQGLRVFGGGHCVGYRFGGAHDGDFRPRDSEAAHHLDGVLDNLHLLFQIGSHVQSAVGHAHQALPAVPVLEQHHVAQQSARAQTVLF